MDGNKKIDGTSFISIDLAVLVSDCRHDNRDHCAFMWFWLAISQEVVHIISCGFQPFIVNLDKLMTKFKWNLYLLQGLSCDWVKMTENAINFRFVLWSYHDLNYNCLFKSTQTICMYAYELITVMLFGICYYNQLYNIFIALI